MSQNQVEANQINQKHFFSGVIWGQISRLGDIGLSFLFSILVVRLLGKTEYGTYATILNIIGFAVVFTGLGFSETLNRYLPQARAANPPFPLGLLRRFLILRLSGVVLAGLVLWLVSPWLAFWLQEQTLARFGWLLFLLLLTFSTSELLNNFYIASFQLKLIFLIRFLTQLIGIVITLGGFWLSGPTAAIPLIVLVITMTVQCLIYLRKLPERALLKAAPIPKNLSGTIYRYSRDLWFINLSTFALAGQFDVLALAFLLKDPSQVAYYSLVTLILARVQSLITGWATSNTSVFSTVYTQEGKSGLTRYFSYYYKLSLVLIFPAIGWLFAVSNVLIPLVFGNEFSPVVPLIWIYICHLFISTALGSINTPNFLLALDRQNKALRWRIFFSLLNIALDLLLIPFFGALGAIIATGISNSGLHFIELWLVRDVAQKLPWLFLVKLSGALVPAVSLGLLSASLIQSNFFGTTIGSGVFVVILLVALLALKPFEASDLALTKRWLPKLASKLRYFTQGV